MRVVLPAAVLLGAFAVSACGGGRARVSTPEPSLTYVPTPGVECEGSGTYLGGTPIPSQADGAFVEVNVFCGKAQEVTHPVSGGTVIEARVGDQVCDRTEVRGGRYTLTVPLGICPPEKEGGGLPVGEVVTFWMGRTQAREVARLVAPLFFHRLDLSFSPVSPQ